VPPHSLEAEQTVLGALLMDSSAVEKTLNIVLAEDFYYEANSEIYDAIKTVHQFDIPVDIITVTNELKKRSKLEQTGGIEYLASLTENIVSTKSILAYIDIIKEKSTLRKIINVSNELIEKGYKENDDVQNLINLAEARIFALSQNRSTNDFSNVKDVLLSVFNQLEERAKTKGSITGVNTGYRDLNRLTAGFQRSDLVLLASRPAMGKTSLALNFAMNAAKSGSSVAMFSLEMSKEQYIQRLISLESLVEISKFRTGALEDEDWLSLANVMNSISSANMYIDDTASISLFDLISKCRRLKIDKGLDLVIIDYLQLMSYGAKAESRQQEISSISRGLKQLARELDCPVLALSQLSRAVEQRPDHRPLLSDLRESGAIEQDADIVMMLYRDEYYYKEESEKKGIAEVILAKHRNGPIGTVELVFIDRFTKFSDKPDDF
jgi:replicative DNA helicase